MYIQSTIRSPKGLVFPVKYWPGDASKNLGSRDLRCVHAISFYGDKMVIVCNKHGRWTPPGGGIEAGESVFEAGEREVKEESNMRVLHQEHIGYQDIDETERRIRQARTFCVVEPIGEFIEDPDGDIIEVRLIDPLDHHKYFDWGQIGSEIMQQALRKLTSYNRKKARQARRQEKKARVGVTAGVSTSPEQA